MKKYLPLSILILLGFFAGEVTANPIRVLFLGHESKHHNSNEYYPMLAKALGPDAIYFDYVTSVEAALGDAEYLGNFDALLLYANHPRLTAKQWDNLKSYVRNGGGFVPVHCASWCFSNVPEFDQLVGGRFKSHQAGTFTARVIKPKHPALNDVKEFNAWDETYFHNKHNEKNRTVLMVRDAVKGDPHTEPEPWTWVRTEGKGRVFYTASGHDQRVWNHPDFHQLIKSGILWAVGEEAKARYDKFLAGRAPLKYEKRDNVPNYERRPEPLPFQFPLSPEESMKYTQVPVGFRLELFASEPDIINPIYFQWDERGRLWVVESVDYPNEIKPGRKGNDRIKICEDTNGDGKADKFTIFAEGFNIPTSMTFARGGVILAHAPDFLFLKDTDGDDQADVRETLFTGFGTGDTHAGPSNLRYGFDNWIYGTVGYSRFNGEVNGKRHNFGSGVFRFKSDGSEMEFLHQFNNNTWGVGFNESGDVFGSTANNNPTFFGGIPNSLYGNQRRMSAKMIASSPKFYPITPNIRQVDAFNAYTAGCGHAFATGQGFPKSWRNRRALVCGPTGNLLGMYDVRARASGYESVNAFSFVASADEWFSPIVAEVGPDGNTWIADWYNFIIQHNPTPNKGRGGYDAKRGVGNAHVNPNRDRQHGRIYRVIYERNPGSKIKSLAAAKTTDLVTALEDENLFWRLTAQRLLVDGRKKEVVPALRQLIKGKGVASIHALWVLHGLDELDSDSHRTALISADPGLRRNAIRALGTNAASTQLLFDSATLADKDLQVRLVAFVKLAQQDDAKTVKKTATFLMAKPENAKDEWLRLALTAAGAGTLDVVGYETGENLISNPTFEKGLQGWSFRNYSGPANEVDRAHETAKGNVRSGKGSLRLGSKVGHDTSFYTSVQLTSGRRYRLSAWIKTEGVQGGHGALLNVHELQHEGKTKALQKKNDWLEVEKVFTATRSGVFTINCLLGGWGKSKGTAWFDDLSLTEYKPVYAKKKTSDPITGTAAAGKVIFHEHLVAGCVRCHSLGGKGGAIGPALDGLASRKQRDYVYQSLVNPTAQLAEGFDKMGASPMPPMNILLNEQELADLMAYLMTLK
jgi:putative membrane-bound dehydrogenase-like protein